MSPDDVRLQQDPQLAGYLAGVTEAKKALETEIARLRAENHTLKGVSVAIASRLFASTDGDRAEQLVMVDRDGKNLGRWCLAQVVYEGAVAVEQVLKAAEATGGSDERAY